jgi:hypothetical protein
VRVLLVNVFWDPAIRHLVHDNLDDLGTLSDDASYTVFINVNVPDGRHDHGKAFSTMVPGRITWLSRFSLQWEE